MACHFFILLIGEHLECKFRASVDYLAFKFCGNLQFWVHVWVAAWFRRSGTGPQAKFLGAISGSVSDMLYDYRHLLLASVSLQIKQKW